MRDDFTLLIIGGYGTFGGRIVQLLENEPRLTLIIAGRSQAKAHAFCEERNGAVARLIPAAFDRNGDIAAQLSSPRPDLLVDASGPFQAYGEGRYRVIEACIAQRIDYLDLADGSEFVAGVSAYDEAARAAGIFVLSGVSSFPVLTAAAVRHLAAGLARVDRIRGGIAPSPYAVVGVNVLRAIAGYAGQKITLRRAGKAAAAYPLTEFMRFTIRPPGRLPLHNRLFSLVDVPDLHALAELWPEAQEIWMGAAPVPEIGHRAFIALAWLARFRLIATLTPLAPLLHWGNSHLRWGEHRGGMFVEIEGVEDAGHNVKRNIKRSWHLLAEGDDGPFIPSMAVEALVRAKLDGQSPAPGARAATRDVELDDYARVFAGKAIYTGTRDETPGHPKSLFAELLVSAWDELPIAIHAMHAGQGTASGNASVERGAGFLGRLAAFVIGFPKATPSTPLTVHFDVCEGIETWTRRFGDDAFSSRMSLGRGPSEGLLYERFGPLTFAMALVVEGSRLSLVLRRWSAFGIPLPMWLCPRSHSYESAEDGLFHVHVELSHPLCGLIVRYKGWLKPKY